MTNKVDLNESAKSIQKKGCRFGSFRNRMCTNLNIQETINESLYYVQRGKLLLLKSLVKTQWKWISFVMFETM